MPPKKKSNKRKAVAVTTEVHQTEEPVTGQGDDTDDDSVTETEAAEAEREEEATGTGGGAVPKRAKKASGVKAKRKGKTPDDDGTVINIVRPDDISEEQELKIVAWVEDNEIIYNQATKDFKNKAKKDRMFAEFGETIGLSGIRIDKWYKSMRSSYGRIKKEFQKSGNAPPVLKYRADWIWKHMAFLKPHVRNKTRGVIMSRGEGDDEEAVEVDDDEASAVSSAAPSQSSRRDSADVPAMVQGKGKAPGSMTKARASSSKTTQLDVALSEYLKKTAPEAATMHKEVQDSLAALTQQRDHAAIWGESLAISARRLPFNLFQRFQMDSLALVNRYLGMAEWREDPDQAQSQSFVQQLQMAPPQHHYQQQYPQHDTTWQPYPHATSAPPLLQHPVASVSPPRFTYTSQQDPNMPIVFDQQQHSTPTSVGSVGANSGSTASPNISSLVNTIVTSPYSQDNPLDNEGDIE